MSVFDQTGVRRSAVGLLLLAFGLVASSAAAEDVTGEVMKQARARQDKVKSFEVKLKQTAVLLPGAITKGTKVFQPVPKEHTVLTSESRLVIQGNKLRYEDVTLGARANRTLQQWPRVFVFGGTNLTTFLPTSPINDDHALAFVHKDQLPGSAANAVWPLLMAFRGLDPDLATNDLRRLVPSDVTMPLLGIPCRRFDESTSGDHKRAFWIDEFGLIRRTTTENNRQLTYQTEIRYERRHGFDAFPVCWTSVILSRVGALQRERTLEVVESKVNEPIAETEFTINFPPGCVIHDAAARKEYVVQSDGSRVEKSQPKRDAEPTGDRLSRYRGPMAVCLAAVLVVVVAGCLVRLRRRKLEANPPSKSA